MTVRSRRSDVALVLTLLLAAALVVACGPDVIPTRSLAAPPATGSGTPGTAGEPSPSLHIDQPPNGEPGSPVGQSDTTWGRIWDRVPSWFPRYPGSSLAEDASAAPSSARYAVPGGDPRDIASWLRSGLETARLSTDVSGPLEDGSMTLDSVGKGTCRVQTTITPLGGMTFITVLYGSDCPVD